jgi:hypothetical protein
MCRYIANQFQAFKLERQNNYMGEEKKIQIGVPGARKKFETWIRDRGGVQVWNNLNFSNPDAGQQFTPALTAGIPTGKPHWSVGRGEVITDINRFQFVKSWKEVKRFRVGVRMGRQGLSLKVTDGGTRRIRAACDKYPGSSYRFDYMTQEAIIEVPEFEP